MGEIADLILDGVLDEETGELIDGEAPGYPRPKRGQARGNAAPVSDEIARRLPHPCPGCKRRFRHKGDLRSHRRSVSH